MNHRGSQIKVNCCPLRLAAAVFVFVAAIFNYPIQLWLNVVK
jgi:hypothetical protein